MNLRKILLSVFSIGVVAIVAVLATNAFFSDTETSEDNIFVAGSLDLKVDSEAHYNGLVCRQEEVEGPFLWLEPEGENPPEPAPEFYGQECGGTWEETDLGAEHKFFNLSDVKPGDFGENTISLHVYDNDSWGRFVISDVHSYDNDCTEPEEDSENDECTVESPESDTEGSGELHENMTFYAWIDQGETEGFQNTEDPGEGDNIWDCNELEDPNDFEPGQTVCDEPLVILPGTVDLQGESHDIWTALAAYRGTLDCSTEDPDGNGQTGTFGQPETYQRCQGLATDGRLVGSTTYYFGLAWFISEEVGNEAQTDSLEADLEFQAVQHRNNPTPPAGFPGP